MSAPNDKSNRNFRRLVRNFAIELAIYGTLVVVYFFVVLRYLTDYLVMLFETDLVTYAVIALVLMILQSVALDYVTTFLLDQVKLERLE